MRRMLIKLVSFCALSLVNTSNACGAVSELRFGYGKSPNSASPPTSWAVWYYPQYVTYDYQMHEVSYSFSEGEYVCFEIGMANVDGPASLLIDKIELDGPSGKITIFNSGFESGSSGWSAMGSHYAEGSFTISTESYEGSKAGKVTLLSSGTYSIYGQVPVAIPQSGNYTVSAYTKVQEEAREVPPEAFFAMEVSNQWVYEGSVKREISEFDNYTFRKDTFRQRIFQNSVEIGNEWYEVWKGYARLWGSSDGSGTYQFNDGLLVGWIPVVAGESKRSLAWVLGQGTEVNLIATFIGTEQVMLGFDTFDAYRFRYNFTFTGPGGTAATTYDWWFVPYIGVVKQQTPGGVANLLSFAIWGGRVSEVSDGDQDALLDYKELTTYHTDPLQGDTDLDGCLDGSEVFGGRNPLVQDSEGDLDMDCAFGLQDAILGLRNLAGYQDAAGVRADADLTGDNRIGIEEVIYVLQKASGMR